MLFFVPVKSRLLILLFAIISVIIYFNRGQQRHNLYTSDACGYYLYLPATFIYHDLAGLKFYPELDKQYRLEVGYSLYDVNGHKLDKYPVGVALFELPLFWLAHWYCILTHNYPADGFTLPYQVAGMLSTVLWVMLGLLVLHGFLRKYYSENITALAIAGIAFGTNLYAYTAFIHGMSHSFSFFLVACVLLLTDKWYTKQQIGTAVLLGITLGIVFVTRPLNIIVVMLPLLWRVYNLQTLRERLSLLWKHIGHMAATAIAFLLVAAIQFSYWKYITLHWLFDAYIGENFTFPNSYTIDGLLSYRKGWFIYTPMAVIMLLGFYFLWKKNRALVPTLASFMILMIYCVFSWSQWWYGGGFSCRPLVETYPVLALPFAAIIEHFARSSALKKVTFFTICSLLIILNIFQTYQYSMGLIHWSRMTKEFYWKVFGKVEFDRKANERYLIKEN